MEMPIMRKVYNALKKHFWPGTLVCPSIVKIWLEYLHSTGMESNPQLWLSQPNAC